jgi:hypothetical protein
MMSLFYYKDAVSSFGDIFCGYSTSTATADYYDICFDDLWLVARRKLDKFIVVAVSWNHTHRHTRES